ncbi:hypothetical protein Tcan_05500 [Toxocara canis]|nr:hypothetical protein Tcan_05500 [Toxocara canis]
MATERFIGILAKAAYGQAALLKRRTIQAKDVENCIRTHGLFEFLEGTLDGWPDMDNARRKGKTQSSAEQKENLPNSQEFPSSEIVAEGKDSSAVEEETSEIDASSSSDVLIAENESNL